MRREVHRGRCPAVIAVAKGNDVDILREFPPGKNRQLIGFRAAVGEIPIRQIRSGRHVFGQFFGELADGRMQINRRGVLQLSDLLLHRLRPLSDDNARPKP